MSTAILRQSLGFTQAELAQIVGVHPLTVSKWERGVLEPTPWQDALLGAFARIPAQRRAEAGSRAARALVGEGSPAALFHLLQTTFSKEKS